MELREKIAKVIDDNLMFHSIRGGIAVFALAKNPTSIADEILKLIEQEYEPVQLEALTDEEILSVLLTVYPGQYSGDSGNWLAPKEREFISSLTQATIAKNQKEQLYRRKG